MSALIHVPFRKTLSVLSVDCTFGKTHSQADYVAIEAWGYHDRQFLCYHSDLEKRGFVDTVAACRAVLAMFPAHYVLIEDAANGPAVIETMASDFPNVLPVPPRGGKEARARAASHMFAAGRVKFAAGAPWIKRKLDNLAKFPKGKHDDDVDATTQAILWMLQEYASGADYGEALKEWPAEKAGAVEAGDRRMSLFLG